MKKDKARKEGGIDMRTNLKKNVACCAALCAFVALFAACKPEKEVEFAFTARLEQIADDDSTQKNYLSKEEKFIRWEMGDAIGIDHNPGKSFPLIHGEGTDDAEFMGAYTVRGSGDRYAIYPYSSMLDDNIETLKFPAEQVYRAGDNKYDSSFGINSFPMVATFTDGSEFVLFHSVCAIVRVQLYAEQEAELSNIQFLESSIEHGGSYQQISGNFIIHDIDKYEPYLEPNDATTEANRTITITDIDKSIGPNTLLTFYLVLPALETVNLYNLKMTVTSNKGTFIKSFHAKTGRNRITPIPALCIKTWEGTESSVDVKLVGNGTEERPFMIYDSADLKLVKTAFDNPVGGKVYINGQEVTKNTWFKLARTDIVLRKDFWTEGINNFKGIMEGSTNSPIEFGVTNMSNAPVFESINSDGIVRYFYVSKPVAEQTYNGYISDFSPLCRENYGLMQNCHNRCNYKSNTGNLAGVCVTNRGKLLRCQNSGNLTATGKYVGGLCLYNYDSIEMCVGIASSRYSGKEAGGICYQNRGVITSCNVTYNNNVDTSSVLSFGCIALENFSTGSIVLCVVSGDLCVSRSEELGGVAAHNSGRIDSCFLNEITAVLKGGKVGGIASVHTNGVIRNCYVTNRIFSSGVGDGCYGGGIVGYMDGGDIENCFAACNITGTKIASIVSQAVSGNVTNCYTYGSSGTYGKIYRVAEPYPAVVFSNCYTSVDDWPDRTGCIKFNYITGENPEGTWFLLDMLNAWINGLSSEEAKKYAQWHTVILPKFNY